MKTEDLEYLKEGNCIKLLQINKKDNEREFVIIEMDNYNNIILLEITSFNTHKEVHVPINWFEQDNVVYK